MKGLYICVGQDLEDSSSGISRKIMSQVNEMHNNGCEVDIINIDNKSNFFDKIVFFMPFVLSEYQKRQIKSIDTYNIEEYDFIYIRKPALSSAIIKLLKRIKNINSTVKIIMEIPTYPIYGEYKGVRKVLIIQSMIFSRKLHRYVDRIVTYSDDKEIWGIKTIRISNSVDFTKVNRKRIKEYRDEINIIAVALFSHWHGYDRFIKGMYYYFKNGGKRKIKLHLVGDSNITDKYKKMVNKYKLNDNVLFYGKKYGKELDKIYDKCDIGLDALARHRSKVDYNSSLKGKEYGAKGLPIISGVKTELDYDEKYEYYLRIPADESVVDINSVITFYDKIYNEKMTKMKVVENIRDYSKERFDFKNAFLPVIKYILTN